MKFKESIPKPEYLLQPGDIILSAGNTFVYEVAEGPVCKLYREIEMQGKAEPWGSESSWYDTGCPIKGWRRKGPNYPSYYVNIIDPDTLERSLTSISLRWIPTKLTLSEAIQKVKEQRSSFLDNLETVTTVYIDPERINRMSESNVNFVAKQLNFANQSH